MTIWEEEISANFSGFAILELTASYFHGESVSLLHRSVYVLCGQGPFLHLLASLVPGTLPG